MLIFASILSSDLKQFKVKTYIYFCLQMTDELLFSTLGLTMDTSIEKQLFSPTRTNLSSDYEVSCVTPLSDDLGMFDSQLNVINSTDYYTDLTCSPQSSWNDWSTTSTTTSSGIFFFFTDKYIIIII